MEMQRIIRQYCEKVYTKKLNNLDEVHQFWETHDLPRLNHEMENLNKPKTSKEVELIIKNLLPEKSPGPDALADKFYQKF